MKSYLLNSGNCFNFENSNYDVSYLKNVRDLVTMKQSLSEMDVTAVIGNNAVSHFKYSLFACYGQ